MHRTPKCVVIPFKSVYLAKIFLRLSFTSNTYFVILIAQMAVMNNFCQSNDKIEIKIEIQHTIEQSTLYSGDHKSFFGPISKGIQKHRKQYILYRYICIIILKTIYECIKICYVLIIGSVYRLLTILQIHHNQTFDPVKRYWTAVEGFTLQCLA